MTTKRLLRPERLRRVPKQFSWVDHRLVRDEHLYGLSHQSQALYLFLLTVSDAQGLSYYSDSAIGRHLSLSASELQSARFGLCEADLIAYARPLYQILSLPTRSSLPLPKRHIRTPTQPSSFGDVLRQALGGEQ